MEVLKHGPPDFCNMIFSSLPKGTWRLLPLRALYSTVTTGHTDVTAACENSKPVDASGSPGSHGFPGSQGCLLLLQPCPPPEPMSSKFSLTRSGTQTLAKADSDFLHSHLLPEISFQTFSPWRILKNRNKAWSSLSNTKCQYFLNGWSRISNSTG